MSIIVFILILALLILVHEAGHFTAAKKQGVKVEEFGFGLPPRIFGKKIGETLYSINLIPLGGFVKLYGEEYHEIKKNKSSSRAFINKKPWQKILVVIGGVIGNFLLGWTLISFLFTQGVPVPTNKVIIDSVQKNSPAYSAGLKEQDEVLRLSSSNFSTVLKTSEDLISFTKKYAGLPINLLIKRGALEKNVVIIPRKNPPAGQGPLGVAITSYKEKKYPWYQAPFYGLIESFSITNQIVTELIKILFQMISLHKPQVEVAGPIGIVRFTSSAIKFGKNAVLELIALLSFNLAIVNILPFPALDGGRLVFVLYEWITKKRVNSDIEKYVNLVGMIILLSLGILISINDVLKLFK